MNFTFKDKGKTADVFGRLKALQAEIALFESDLKAKLMLEAERDANGVLAINGDTFRVTISEIAAGERFDPKKAKALLSPEAIKRCMTPTDPTFRYNAKARIAEAA